MSSPVNVAFETNGSGYMGFLCEYPGAFVRGKTLDEALSKVEHEVKIFKKWLGMDIEQDIVPKVVQIHKSSLKVEDADNEILLNDDKEKMDIKEFEMLADLVTKSAKSTFDIFDNAKYKDWIDSDRDRATFYGHTPKTIREIFEHIDSVQYYYLSRLNIDIPKEGRSFLEGRQIFVEKIASLFNKEGNSRIYSIDNEDWTVKKVLRRFIWHDRIHAKSMVKILRKQKETEIIDSYSDPFYFFMEKGI